MSLKVRQDTLWVKDNKEVFMKFDLIKGCFNNDEAMELLTQLLHVKIRFHENKIRQASNIEDIEHREQRIIELQKSLYETQRLVTNSNELIELTSQVSIEKRKVKQKASKYNLVSS